MDNLERKRKISATDLQEFTITLQRDKASNRRLCKCQGERDRPSTFKGKGQPSVGTIGIWRVKENSKDSVLLQEKAVATGRQK